MKNFRKVVLLSFSILSIIGFFSSCGVDHSGLQPSTGKTNEMLIVTNSDADWKGKVGLAIKSFFGQNQLGLPQHESMYTMAHIPESNFSKMFQTHHNIFIVDVNPDFKEAILETKKDLWAMPQRIVKVTVPDYETFFKEFDENKEAFIELFNASERRRVNRAFAAIEDYKIKKQIIQKYDVDLVIPESFYIATQTDVFVWLRREAERFSQAVMIYFYPYRDTISFSRDRILELRDSITKKHIPGPAAGSYMKIAMSEEPPVCQRIDFNDRFAVETRGIWELEGDFMGGPFLGYTFVDERYQRVVTIDSYVYNPGQKKRDLVRQVESILHTFSFPQKEELSKK